MTSKTFLFLTFAVISLGIRPNELASADLAKLRSYSLVDFTLDHPRSYKQGTDEWSKREEIFKSRMAEVIAHQSGEAKAWKKGINKFMDYTDAEFHALLGYKRPAGAAKGGVTMLRGNPGTLSASATVGAMSSDLSPVTLPQSHDLSKSLSTFGKVVRDQGSCGSCWAMAATGALEAAVEANSTVLASLAKFASDNNVPTLSSQTMVSCTKNPRNCGGSGGCSGATAQLGFEEVYKNGIGLAKDNPYEVSYDGMDGVCKSDLKKQAYIGIDGYVTLPRNQFEPLLQALYQKGPIVVSADATNWMMYAGGVFTDCDNFWTVNHAVILFGFNRQASSSTQNYWLIKNSWGEGWGEDGFIRLQMLDDEQGTCGMDQKAHEGVACDGDPDEVEVCGNCGILFDSSYAVGARLVASKAE